MAWAMPNLLELAGLPKPLLPGTGERGMNGLCCLGGKGPAARGRACATNDHREGEEKQGSAR